jgi:hypothetical protein
MYITQTFQVVLVLQKAHQLVVIKYIQLPQHQQLQKQ